MVQLGGLVHGAAMLANGAIQERVMLPQDDVVASLREALQVSPTNLPLHKHLATVLMSASRFAEAERAYLDALAIAPRNSDFKLGLAQAYLQQGKVSAALVVVEDVLAHDEGATSAKIFYARLLLRDNQPDRARFFYREALDQDPNLADAELARELGVEPGSDENQDDWEVTSDGRMRQRAGEGPVSDFDVTLERPEIKFADVGGMEPVKQEIRLKIILPLQHPEMFQAYGRKTGGGILMYGPPGCGKTYLARATAGEVQASFIVVGINDILDMWIGNSEKNLHAIFAKARRSRPCVLFFDEVDALGASRADMRQSGGRHLINQFLAELDGVQASNEGVLILAATNAPWHLDTAFRRPGRFDRVLFVPPPDAVSRAEILRLLIAGKPSEGVDFDQVARKTDEFSGADLQAVVDRAVEAKLQVALQTGKLEPLRTKDLLTAASSSKPTTREWFSSARNYALYSNQGGAYDEILKYLKL